MKDNKKQKNNNDSENNNSFKKFFQVLISLVLIIVLGIGVYAYFNNNNKKSEDREVSYTQLIKDIKDNKVQKIELTDGSDTAKITYKEEYRNKHENSEEGEFESSTEETENEEVSFLKSVLSNKKVDEDDIPEDEKNTTMIPDMEAFIELVQSRIEEGSDVELVQNPRSPLIRIFEILLNFLPTIIMVVLIILLFQMQGLGDKGKVYDPTVNKDNVTFKDVAGLTEEKAEMMEVVDFLKNPDKYTGMGARVPKGVLLCGKPGTGKTLIAKAIAGEANVPFISMSGSEFVELFAGLGASRVRKLFEKAKKIAPCIIFIDEIDALGSRRESSFGGADSENNQTLNQLLVEMDGFDTDQSIIVIAATNRPEMLDDALLRPGRFDRRINIGLPDINDREKILALHAENKKLGKDVDLKSIAGDTAGFSGAELENILNEAAILATKNKHDAITNQDIEDAVKKVTVGLEKKERIVSDKDKKLTAYHEAGHAVVSKYLPTQDFVKEVSIIPRGVAGGYTMYKTLEDKFYVSKTEMEEKLISLMGGRAAEKVALDDISTGASNDIEVAMKIARDMITVYGMSDKIGPMSLNMHEDIYPQLQLLGSDIEDEIGKEVKAILDKAYKQAQDLLKEHRDKLDTVANILVEKEKINEEEFKKIFE